MKFQIDWMDHETGVRQIANVIRFGLVSGELRERERLMNASALARWLGVRVMTAAQAYGRLDEMGIVERRKGRGTFILDGSADRCRSEFPAEIASRLDALVTEAKEAGFSKVLVRNIIKKSYSCDSILYDETPTSVRALLDEV